jgi:hypothetical protein
MRGYLAALLGGFLRCLSDISFILSTGSCPTGAGYPPWPRDRVHGLRIMVLGSCSCWEPEPPSFWTKIKLVTKEDFCLDNNRY